MAVSQCVTCFRVITGHHIESQKVHHFVCVCGTEWVE